MFVEPMLRLIAAVSQAAVVDSLPALLIVGLVGIALVATVIVARAIVAAMSASAALPAERSRRDLVGLQQLSVDSDPDAAGHTRSRAPSATLAIAGR